MKVGVIGAEDTTMRRMIKFLPKNADYIILSSLGRGILYDKKVPEPYRTYVKEDLGKYDEAIRECEVIYLFCEEESEDTEYIRRECEKHKKKLIVYDKQP